MNDRLAGVTETEMLRDELREVTGNRRLQTKDIDMWSASKATVEREFNPELQQIIYCPSKAVWVLVSRRRTL